MINIIIPFNQDSFNSLTKFDNENAIFLADKCYGQTSGLYITELSTDQELQLCNMTRSYFEFLSCRYKTKLIYGFVNNFYECVIYPLSRIILNIEEIRFKNQNQDLTIILDKNYVFSNASSFYYMAEHESHGVHLFNKEFFYLFYIKKLCKKLGIKIVFNTRSYKFTPIFYNFIRIYLVLVLRFISSFFKFSFGKALRKINSRKYDAIFISRSLAQTSTIANFIKLSNIKSLLLVGSSFFDFNKNSQYVKSLFHTINSCDYQTFNSLKFRTLFTNYINAFLNIKRLNKEVIRIGCIDFDISNAIKEVFVMLPDLISYESSVIEALDTLDLGSNLRFFSMEQKSPYAYADACLGSAYNGKTLHIMQCDQDVRLLPCLVFGDFYLTDTKKKCNDMSMLASNFSNKFKYVGSFKSVYQHHNILTENFNLYFFTHSDDINFNKIIINLLLKLKLDSNFKIFIKLHPRDFLSNYTKQENLTFITEGDIDRDLMFSSITLALSFPSGVITDLLFREIPTIILGFGPGYNYKNFDYWCENTSCVKSLDELDNLFLNLDDNYKKINEYAKYYKKSLNIISDPEVIKCNLLNLN